MKFTFREMLLFVALIAVGFGWFASFQFDRALGANRLVFEKNQTVLTTHEGTFYVSEHHLNAFLGTPIFQVWFKKNKTAREQCILTVETLFQESASGIPLVMKNGTTIQITDAKRSFAYDFERGGFSVNEHPQFVYEGTYRSALVPPSAF